MCLRRIVSKIQDILLDLPQPVRSPQPRPHRENAEQAETPRRPRASPRSHGRRYPSTQRLGNLDAPDTDRRAEGWGREEEKGEEKVG